MPGKRDRVLAYLAAHPEGQDDDQIGVALHIDRHDINAICRRLAETGVVSRSRRSDGSKIITSIAVAIATSDSSRPVDAHSALNGEPLTPNAVVGPVVWLSDHDDMQRFAYLGNAHLSEDQVKSALKQVFEGDGWHVEVRWGHVQGIDVEAIHGNDRFVLEAKGEGSSAQVQGNFFDGALGELLRRMNAPGVRYGLALPAHRRFTGLVGRLPMWVRQRLGLWFFFVRPSEYGLEVGAFPPDGGRTSL